MQQREQRVQVCREQKVQLGDEAVQKSFRAKMKYMKNPSMDQT